MRRWLCVPLLLLSASPAAAATIDFTTLSRSAAETLQIGDVTITGVNGGLVSTVLGVGLGVGADGSWDANFHVDAGGSTAQETGDAGGGLNIAVNGTITGFTVRPYMVIDGPPLPDGVFLGFLARFDSVSPGGDGTKNFSMLAPFDEKTLDYTILQMTGMDRFALGGDASFYTLSRAYLAAYDFPDASFHYGFSITSIDYIPVPEPSTWLLLLCGLIGLHGAHRVATRT
jgi:hypothetical protein